MNFNYFISQSVNACDSRKCAVGLEISFSALRVCHMINFSNFFSFHTSSQCLAE